MHGSFKKSLAALAALAALWATPAAAQVDATFVSKSGVNGNPCTELQPCRTFQRAHDATNPGGSVNVIDAAEYGVLVITKSIIVNGNGLATITGPLGSNGVLISPAATDRVVIDGVLINAVGSLNAGIHVQRAREVLIRNTVVRGFLRGVQVSPQNILSVVIENSTIVSNAVGISVAPTGFQATVRLYDSLVMDSTVVGVKVDGASARAEISGNQIVRSPKPLEIVNGAAIYSYGDNVVGPGADVPTPASKM